MAGQTRPEGRLRLDATLSTATDDNSDVFDDGYAIDSPSDSEFHQSDGLASNHHRSSRSQPAPPAPAESSLAANQDVKRPPVESRNSTYKNPAAMAGFEASRSGRPASPLSGRTPAVADGTPTPLADLPQRASSVASSYAPTDRNSSPPPSGPSFPYHLYQQNNTGVGRTPSMATTSTSHAPGRQSVSATGPAHPYALYRQNFAEEEAPAPAPAQAIPVGLAVAAGPFSRQFGPDGEEQDIIGPDGHAEQLPPYSRYPEEAPAKVAVVPGLPSHDPNPLPESPHQPPRSANGSTAAILDSSDGGAGEAENKTWNEKTWKERRRTKLCWGRLPCWIVAVLVACAVIIVGLVAGLVGGLVSQHKKDSSLQREADAYFDATAIPTPTGVPGPPSGAWALPLGIPEEQQSGCLADSSQLDAWTCFSLGPPLALNITAAKPGQKYAGSALLGELDPTSVDFNYGVQPPRMEMTSLEWVQDLDDIKRGPALHFQAVYDKIVIVAGDAFDDPSARRRILRRGGGGPPAEWWEKKGRVEAGDQPWVCFWNNTFLEGFIYVTEDSDAAASQSSVFAELATHSPVTEPATAASTTPSEPAPTSEPVDGAAPTPLNGNARFTHPADTDDSGAFYAWLSSVQANPAAQSLNARAPADGAGTLPTPTTSDELSSTITSVVDVDGDGDGDLDDLPSVYTVVASGTGTADATSFTVPTIIPLFPRIVKIEERRMQMGDNKAQCVKMQLLDNDDLIPLKGPVDGKVMFELNEVDPSQDELDGADDEPRRRRYRRMWDGVEVPYRLGRRSLEPSDSCHCQWRND